MGGCSASAAASAAEQKMCDPSDSQGHRRHSDRRDSESRDSKSRHSESRQSRNIHKEYLFGQKVGRGSFAQVRLATKAREPDGYPLAVKIVDLRDPCDAGKTDKVQQRAVQIETDVWQKVGRHPNVIALIECFYNESLYYFVMEKCSGSLLSALQNENELNEKTLSVYLYQMAQGIAHVHSAAIVHRDIKPDNFLIAGADAKQVKLGDFGLSASMPARGGLKGVFGTAPFMSPEMLEGRSYSDKVDVWSLGVIAYVLLFGSFPYTPREHDSKAMKKAIISGSPPPPFTSSRFSTASRSSSATAFVKDLLVRNPDDRPCAAEILRSPYMEQASGSPEALPWPVYMPSLRSMLHAAKKAGAFENRDITRSDAVDHLMNKLQKKHRGVPLPASGKEQLLPMTAHSYGGRRPSRNSGSAKSVDANKLIPGDPTCDNPSWDTSSTRSSDGQSTRSEADDTGEELHHVVLSR